LLEPHLDALYIINNGFRGRLSQIENFVAEKVKKYFAADAVPVNLKKELSELLTKVDAAYEVIGGFEAELQDLVQHEEHTVRVKACNALKDFDFSAMNGLI
jgi:hypothetical protein